MNATELGLNLLFPPRARQRVQSKVQTLQDQLSDALGDLSMARRREEALKAEVAVMATKLEDRGTELAKAQVISQQATNASLV